MCFCLLSEGSSDIIGDNYEKEGIFMFREMRRKNQQLTDEECIRILKTEPRGVLSLLGDGGYPYGVPMDFWYNETDGCLYFHCAREGHKIDAIRGCGKASFCVMDSGFRREGEWALNIQSVIVFGCIQILTDQEEAIAMVRQFAYKYVQDTEYIEKDVRQAGHHVLIFKLVPEHITGKQVKES